MLPEQEEPQLAKAIGVLTAMPHLRRETNLTAYELPLSVNDANGVRRTERLSVNAAPVLVRAATEWPPRAELGPVFTARGVWRLSTTGYDRKRRKWIEILPIPTVVRPPLETAWAG